MSIPSRRPFVHVIGNVCPFATSAPFVGYVIRKSGKAKYERWPNEIRRWYGQPCTARGRRERERRKGTGSRSGSIMII
jgi:hypothetical protein